MKKITFDIILLIVLLTTLTSLMISTEGVKNGLIGTFFILSIGTAFVLLFVWIESKFDD